MNLKVVLKLIDTLHHFLNEKNHQAKSCCYMVRTLLFRNFENIVKVYIRRTQIGVSFLSYLISRQYKILQYFDNLQSYANKVKSVLQERKVSLLDIRILRIFIEKRNHTLILRTSILGSIIIFMVVLTQKVYSKSIFIRHLIQFLSF